MIKKSDLLQDVITGLQEKQLKVATAESCTGGLVASLLTDLPGSSAWFECGFVTYSNLAKHRMLGVPDDLISLHGAVSEPVAKAMALGALSNSDADMAVAVTGIAGPDGGSIEKPVGTVWFAWVQRGGAVHSLHCQFAESASREKIRQLACEQALHGILSLLHK